MPTAIGEPKLLLIRDRIELDHELDARPFGTN